MNELKRALSNCQVIDLSMIKVIFALSVLLWCGCARSSLKPGEVSLRPVSELPEGVAGGDIPSLIQATQNQIEFWRRQEVEEIEIFDKNISRLDLIASLEGLLEKVSKTEVNSESLRFFLNDHFDFFEAYGRAKWGEVLVTGYFEPLILASKQSKPPYLAPLLRYPDPALLGEKPWPPRAELETLLYGQGLELAYLDPIDLFHLQTQGSGALIFEDGSILRVGYAGDNGQKYYAIGRSLLDVIAKDQMSWTKIEEHLRSLPTEEALAVLQLNPRYIFFEKRTNNQPLTSLGVPAVKERSLAVDSEFYPTKGLLALLEFGDPEAEALTARLVYDVDQGGGVKGAGHVDLFMGSGDRAGVRAGQMKHSGRLTFLLPKSTSRSVSEKKKAAGPRQ